MRLNWSFWDFLGTLKEVALEESDHYYKFGLFPNYFDNVCSFLVSRNESVTDRRIEMYGSI